MSTFSPLVLGFGEIGSAQLSLVGGKGVNLAALSGMQELQVPEGFCVTTTAYRQAVEQSEAYHALLDRLAALKAADREQIGEISGKLRQIIMEAEMPAEVVQAVTDSLSRLGAEHAYAVRSSATAEDLPHASFAGQQDTYLNIIGREAILRHIGKCWASLFTDRAVVYRMQNGFGHHVYLSVIVQRMVVPQASGIMFTADPITGSRKLVSIDAGYGLGEALVSGIVSADNYRVRDEQVVDKRIATKTLAVYSKQEGGTETLQLESDRQQSRVLTDEQVLQLARIGRRIEARFGRPQDIEWCLADDTFHMVQSRPITTLYPIPETSDPGNRVYISVGHQQMMTDPMRPLGLSFYLMVTPAPMRKAGGRLFVDVTKMLASPPARDKFFGMLGQAEPLTKDALTTIVERGDFIQPLPDETEAQRPANGGNARPPAAAQAPIDNDPAIVAELIGRNQRSIAELKHAIQAKSGLELVDFIRDDIDQGLKKILFDPQSTAVFMAAMNASAWINEHMKEWLGETNAADTLTQSVPNNITSEMGLALLDVADAIRPYPDVIAYLQHAAGDRFLDELAPLDGGRQARAAIEAYLDQYGMRCAGEIDITRTRWSENPLALVPLLVGNIKNFEPNESRRRFERGRQEALEKEQELLARLRQLPDGERKAEETKGKIDLVRNYIGYREYPKYGMVSRFFVYKQALMKEADRLVQAGVISEREEVYDLTFEELREAVRDSHVDRRMIGERREAYQWYAKLTPPRVITSDGEIVRGSYKRANLPAGAIIGLPVSSGIVEGRARVILNMADADLEDGDILVTSFTDPSWTPLFVSITGLVAEVGGLMTHGAVIAREYGLPAVVGVENATKLIKDGQRIRVNGTDGVIEVLS